MFTIASMFFAPFQYTHKVNYPPRSRVH